jgi:hypothetical protein
MVNIGRAEGRAAVALHGRGVGGQHADAKAVAEAGADFSALDFQGLGEWKGIQPCRGWAARAAEQAGASTPPFCGAGVKRFQQGVGWSLCRVPQKLALCCFPGGPGSPPGTLAATEVNIKLLIYMRILLKNNNIIRIWLQIY